MYSLSYTDLFIKRIKRLTFFFFGGEVHCVWGGRHQSSILSQTANKKQEEKKGWVRENTLDREKAESIVSRNWNRTYLDITEMVLGHLF